jgi:hypothetical protein
VYHDRDDELQVVLDCSSWAVAIPAPEGELELESFVDTHKKKDAAKLREAFYEVSGGEGTIDAPWYELPAIIEKIYDLAGLRELIEVEDDE